MRNHLFSVWATAKSLARFPNSEIVRKYHDFLGNLPLQKVTTVLFEVTVVTSPEGLLVMERSLRDFSSTLEQILVQQNSCGTLVLKGLLFAL